MRGILLYNPASGTSHARRAAVVEDVATRLRSHGYELETLATTHRGSAGDQAREAIANGAEVIFICGGDGTIHDALQGIAGTTAKLAIIPLGSANALCRELGIPLHPLKAAEAYQQTSQRDLQLTRCKTPQGERQFLIMAGAGPDGALMYRMLTASKGKLGRWTYAMHALHLLLRARFHKFQVRYETLDGISHTTSAISAMALRIGNLGGIFPGIARGASLDNAHMRLFLVKPPAMLGLPLWFLFSWLHLDRWNPYLQTADVRAFHCESLENKVYAQADGEWIGTLPLSAELDEQTITLLIPSTEAKR
ncbi:diacylglycerol/lipid kinase family protein [Terriglobus roseus]|uniref:Diacylglycerol kinase family enzyme n=1 Tax=Terriglobus roseus TaxID=392734 RepID=A0A1G7I781_9BACT|nr:diacylglycerol kinase family protein [Terriglobus roseus]SDF08570.1 Diacylglycerol kinase family enzyme [Terriglobus roseus]